jgi:hypothetical protein
MTVLNEPCLLYPTPVTGRHSTSAAAQVATPAQTGASAQTGVDVQVELDRLIESLATSKVQSPKNGKVAPLYLIVSNKRGLIRKYKQSGFRQLDHDLRQLERTIEEHTHMQAIIIYVDDEASLAPYGMEPVDPANPWQVKTLIDNLDTRLTEQGQAVRYILIVGGNSIIPFHLLPNPIDDQDTNVPSDNPYASRDVNYLIPDRAVGRMPDGEGESVEFLHTLLRTAIAGHQKPAAPKGLLSDLINTLWSAETRKENGNGLGYSASIWRRASRAVFKTIGDNRRLRTSPPFAYEEFGIAEQLQFSYFNLHGIEDGAEWYGQPDALFPADYPLFPVALRPQDLSPEEHANSIVFTEACYGANILGKNTDTSIALRFLASRALALIGSTKIAYGSLAPPLVGADLVSKNFWEGLQTGLTVGEALKYAKINMAKELHGRQGYLDGEDQKTLISFVLYGDPSLTITALQDQAAVKIAGKVACPPLICQKKKTFQKGLVSDRVIAAIKQKVETDLPYMAQARVRAAPLKLCSGSCSQRCNPTCGTVKAAKTHAGKWAFILEKDIPSEDHRAHHQVIKITADANGHIIKMAMSK